ncbi:MAG: 4Fe-4S binding protein [Anaeromicrobium sp.]|jgi:formate hydrogenlyase subunit 6/NADH:ubiquinone oxidoreductase subunit I|uniref:4Fe-4S binding protein n=1 Tax=Anaeromicrobium sp. TaxID=1929132 RepID=UPI0025EADE55|nr:4Fe-4S binding protein [Anaeromicrobium sp.]MCT4593220.1 4Fe-4S binding protein [Anaeromicrobium sp.]
MKIFYFTATGNSLMVAKSFGGETYSIPKMLKEGNIYFEDNIKVDHKVNFEGQCIRCYACTQNCPSNAIRFNGEKSKTRYRNSHISLKEIILANK